MLPSGTDKLNSLTAASDPKLLLTPSISTDATIPNLSIKSDFLDRPIVPATSDFPNIQSAVLSEGDGFYAGDEFGG
jgi:hypothetical protein